MNEEERRQQDRADQERARQLELKRGEKICRCCPDCSDFPCDGALDAKECEHIACVCGEDVA